MNLSSEGKHIAINYLESILGKNEEIEWSVEIPRVPGPYLPPGVPGPKQITKIYFIVKSSAQGDFIDIETYISKLKPGNIYVGRVKDRDKYYLVKCDTGGASPNSIINLTNIDESYEFAINSEDPNPHNYVAIFIDDGSTINNIGKVNYVDYKGDPKSQFTRALQMTLHDFAIFKYNGDWYIMSLRNTVNEPGAIFKCKGDIEQDVIMLEVGKISVDELYEEYEL